MEPNQYQPQRTDYQAVPVNRAQPNAGPALPAQPLLPAEPAAAAAQAAQGPSLDPAGPSAEQLVSAEPVVQPPSQPAIALPPTQLPTTPQPVIMSDTRPSLPPAGAPTAHAAPAAQPISPVAAPSPVVSGGANPLAAAPAPRPWQTPAPAPVKTPIWKKQKFWLIAVSGFFLIMFSLGGFAWYRATHHAADIIVPKVSVSGVDASNDTRKVGSNAQDVALNDQRQQGILSLRSYIESYYTSKAIYPTDAQMNDSKWVTANLKGVTPGMLKDPQGTVSGLVSQPSKGRYAYQAYADSSKGGCDNAQVNCNYYELTAILSDGSSFVKSAIQ